MSRGYLM